jgi:hypothetical protein
MWAGDGGIHALAAGLTALTSLDLEGIRQQVASTTADWLYI